MGAHIKEMFRSSDFWVCSGLSAEALESYEPNTLPLRHLDLSLLNLDRTGDLRSYNPPLYH